MADIQSQWEEFKSTHKKSYDDDEEKSRFEIFQDNVRKIEEHNKRFDAGDETYKMGITKFTDLTAEESKKSTGGLLGRKK